MIGRPRTFMIVLAAIAAAVAVVRHVRGHAIGRSEPGGMIMGDAVAYDVLSRLLFGPLFGRIADDVAADVPDGARVLDVGCGPGHLSIRLARQPGLEVTGLDLDPAMIERARANADRAASSDERRPSFRVGDSASVLFPDGSLEWSAPCRCTTGPTRRHPWRKSAACCDPAAERSSGTSGTAPPGQSTHIGPIRSNTLMAPRFAW